MAPETSRRRLLQLTLGGGTALAAVTAATRVLGREDALGAVGRPGGLTLLADQRSGVDALDVPLGGRLLPRSGAGHWESRQLPTSTHSMVGFTWATSAAGAHDAYVHIRSRRAGTWSDWERMPHLHDVPDPNSPEASTRTGTDLVWVGSADGIQVRVHGHRPAGLTMVLLHPRPLALDGKHSDALGVADARATTTTNKVPKPTILTRKQWGADESWRNGGPYYNTTIQQAHVHHTANANGYTKADVPSLLRGIYRYHTKSLGWSDIAYNFLVDKFGRTWEGRYGGMARPVRGAHTLGFNATSTGISCIGNFQATEPTAGMLAAIAALAAWKLDMYNRNPLGTCKVTSEGSDRFAAGKVVTLPVLDGHRDTNHTECPGQLLYNHLPALRQSVQGLMDKAHNASPTITWTTPPTVTGTAALAQTLVAHPGVWTPSDATLTLAWLSDGTPISGATGTSYECTPDDVGHQISLRATLTKTDLKPVTVTIDAGGLVTAESLTAVRSATSADGTFTVDVTVEAPWAVPTSPTGGVVVKLNNREKDVTLSDGAAEAVFGSASYPLKSGSYTLTVSYAGDGVFQPSSATSTVQV